MNKRRWIGLATPVLISAVVFGLSFMLPLSLSLSRGIQLGLSIALLQSFLSVGSMNWAWNKHFFYWIWGGGMLFRMLVFAATAFVVYRYTRINLVSCMITLVTATMLFLVIESLALFGHKK